MTANQLVGIIAPVLLLLFFGTLFIRARKRKQDQPPKEHGPHTPGAGYDAKELARSKGNGMGDSGIG